MDIDPPRAAPRRHLLGGLRDAHRRRRGHHLEPRRQPHAAAEFVNKGRGPIRPVVQDESRPRGFSGWTASSKRRAFLASPMEFSRVTSGFAMRMHPILNQWRAHKGDVDYGAPSGTPVRPWPRGHRQVRRPPERLRQRRRGRTRQRRTLYAHLSPSGRAPGGQASTGRVGAVGDRLGPPAAPALRVQLVVAGQSAGHRQGVRGTVEAREPGAPAFCLRGAADPDGQLDAAFRVGAAVAGRTTVAASA